MVRPTRHATEDANERTLGEVRSFSLSSRFLAEGDHRFDAKVYAQESFAKLSALERTGVPLEPLSARVAHIYHPTENQPRSSFKRVWVKAEEGYPFLTGKQLTFFRPEKLKFISRHVPKLHELRVDPGIILLSRSGTTGVPVLVGEWLSQFSITDDALRVIPGEAPVGFVYAYLASSFGSALMVRNEYGATVPHLEAKHVLSIPVPSLPKNVEESVHDRIVTAYRLRDRANTILDGAENSLHALLGVAPFTEDDIVYLGKAGEPRAYRVSSEAIQNRLDAQHYLPIQESVIRKLRGGKFPLVEIGERVELVDVAPRFARVYVEKSHGLPFLQGSQLPQMYPLGLKYISRTITKNLSRWIIGKDLVLVTRSGTIGRISVSTKLHEGWAASEHIMRIRTRDRVSHPGFLALFLASPFGQHQIYSKVYGGVVDELTAEDIAILKVPDVPWTEQAKLGRLVLKAYELRDEASVVEREAVEHLEDIIEGGVGGGTSRRLLKLE